MAYDQDLAERLRMLLEGEPGLREQAMFGGLAFLLGGNMAISASGQGGLLVRCDPADTERWVAHEHVERFAMRGRAMDGWLHVDAQAVTDETSLHAWVDVGAAYARTLPAK